MSNGFFNHDNPESRRTLARAESLNATFQAIQDGFDKLPAEAVLKQGRVTYGTDSGVANAYVVTLPHAPAAYTEGMEIVFRPLSANAGASTVNVYGPSGALLGVKSIRRHNGDALLPLDLVAGGPSTLRYDGTVFRLGGIQGGDVAVAVAAAAAAVAAQQTVAADKQTVHDDRVLAEAARTAAQGYAAGLNLPALAPGDAGKALIVNPAGTGYLTGQAGLLAATAAEAAAGLIDNKAVTPLGLAGWLPNLSLLASANINKDTDRIPVLSTTAGGMRWIKPAFLGGVSLVTKTANYTAIASDNTGGLKFTTAATLTLPAASTLPADWAVTVLARSTGTVLIAAAGADTVAGSAAYVLRSGQDCRITRESSSSFEVTAVGQSIYDSLAAWNPAAKGTGVVLSNNNLTATFPGASSVRATIGAAAGKRYYEAILTGATYAAAGLSKSTSNLNGAPGSDANSWAYLSDGRKYAGGTSTAYGSAVPDGGRVRIAHNADTGGVWVAVGATWQGGGDPVAGTNPTFTGVTGALFPTVGDYGGGSPASVVTGVFAASAFAYAPPSGFSPYI